MNFSTTINPESKRFLPHGTDNKPLVSTGFFVMRKHNITNGSQFGYWTVKGFSHINSNGRTYWEVKCRCGFTKSVSGTSLVTERTKSCHSCANTTHGLKKHPLYKTWVNMKQRCYNPSHREFKYWGGNGITIYNKWINDFAAFYNWCMNSGWKIGFQLDRKESTKNYVPNNIQFLTSSEHGKKGSDGRSRNGLGRFI